MVTSFHAGIGRHRRNSSPAGKRRPSNETGMFDAKEVLLADSNKEYCSSVARSSGK
jgi:hypothetical protein